MLYRVIAKNVGDVFLRHTVFTGTRLDAILLREPTISLPYIIHCRSDGITSEKVLKLQMAVSEL